MSEFTLIKSIYKIFKSKRLVQTSLPVAYITAVLLVLITLPLLKIILYTHPQLNDLPFLIYFVVIVLSASFGGIIPGLLATFLAASCCLFLFSYQEKFETIGIKASTFISEGIFISVLIGQLRQAHEKSLQRTRDLIEAEQHLRDILNGLSFFIGVLTKKGILTEANTASLEAVGLKAEDVIGKPFYKTKWWSFSKAVQTKLKEAIRRASLGEIIKYDTPVVLKNKKISHMDFCIFPIKNNNGQVEYLIPSATDISERTVILSENQKLIKQLETQKRRLQTFVSNIPALLIEMEKDKKLNDFKIKFINNYVEKMLGYKAGDCNFIPNLWMKIVHPEDRTFVVEEVKKTFKNIASGPIQFRCITKNGKEIWVETSFLPIKDSEGKIKSITAVLTDVTLRIKENKIKDEFMGMASHEFKTPLTTIKAFSQILEKRLIGIQDKTSTNYLMKMIKHINKLSSLINDFLDFSKVQSGQMQYNMERFKFDNLLSDTVVDMKTINPDRKITIKGKSGAYIYGDKIRVTQVIINLVSNAIKYSLDKSEVIINVFHNNKQIVLSVQDFGIGIPKSQHKKIFNRFYRIEEGIQGRTDSFGLGLYIVKEIIKRHKGKIWLKSTPGEGTTFYVAFSISK